MTSVPLSEGRRRVANTGGVLLAGRRGLPPLASTQRLLGKRHLGRTSARIDINSPRVPGGLVVVLHLIGRHQPLAHMRAGSPGKTSISYESGPPDWGAEDRDLNVKAIRLRDELRRAGGSTAAWRFRSAGFSPAKEPARVAGLRWSVGEPSGHSAL